MKENSNNKYVMNVKNDEISDTLSQNLSEWQIYASTESPGESSKRISGKVDFIVVSDLNILLGLINHGENVSVKGIALEIRKLFRKIKTSKEPLWTLNYMRYLCQR